jgi:hypothetical protein
VCPRVGEGKSEHRSLDLALLPWCAQP